jgi:hypothetical protein
MKNDRKNNNKLERIRGEMAVVILKYYHEIYHAVEVKKEPPPIKRVDVPASIRTRKLTDARQSATASFISLSISPY